LGVCQKLSMLRGTKVKAPKQKSCNCTGKQSVDWLQKPELYAYL